MDRVTDRAPSERAQVEPGTECSMGPDPTPTPVDTEPRESTVLRIEDLPKEVGVMLLAVGTLGWVLPGVVGAPALIAGGLVLWPKRFTPIENWFARKFPFIHGKSMEQIARYLMDLERRYPGSSTKSPTD